MAKKSKDQELKEKCRILTPEFRVSYPHVFKPNAMKGADPKYSITMLFPKDADLTVIKRAIANAKRAEFGRDKEEWPRLASPFTDGDDPKYVGKEGYKGHWALKAVSNEQAKPGVVDEDVQPITNPADFYPGCYARAQVFARVWEFSGKQGVHFILDHVQKTRDGKNFGGKKAASEVFQPITSDADDDAVDDEEDFT